VDRKDSSSAQWRVKAVVNHTQPVVYERTAADHEHDGAFRAILSPRELQALRLAARGWTNGEIAAELGITVHGVKFHLASIYRKLGVTNRTEAAIKFIESRREPVAKDG
jgi:DNA-binding NarL/FixJ family response regulator